MAADSGKSTNVYSTDTQYYDTVTGAKSYAAYSASFGGTVADAQPYPASGCPAQTTGAPCLTDAQIAAEIDRVATANHLPRGLGSVYYVFFPPNVASCFDTTSQTCSATYFCAYHSSFANGSGTTLYADMPYVAIAGCDPGQRPNGDPADATLNVLSHENNETITDPLGTAWYDSQGNENGDKCNFTFGSPLAGAAGAYYNQLIAGHGFWLQEEWSNAAAGCLQRTGTTTPPPSDFSVAATPSSVSVSQGVSARSTVSTAVTSGSAASVTLSATGLPAGATASFSPASVTAGQASTLTLATSAQTPAATYSVTVAASGAGVSHTAKVSLTVTTANSGGGGATVVNPGFETGAFGGWTTLGQAFGISKTAHTGLYSAIMGRTTPTNGDSTVSQTITAPPPAGHSPSTTGTAARTR